MPLYWWMIRPGITKIAIDQGCIVEDDGEDLTIRKGRKKAKCDPEIVMSHFANFSYVGIIDYVVGLCEQVKVRRPHA